MNSIERAIGIEIERSPRALSSIIETILEETEYLAEKAEFGGYHTVENNLDILNSLLNEAYKKAKRIEALSNYKNARKVKL